MEQNNSTFNLYKVLNDVVIPLFSKAKKWLLLTPVAALLMFWLGYSKENEKKPIFSCKITYMLEDDITTDAPKATAGSEILMALSGQPMASNKNIMVDLSLSNKLVEETLLRLVKIDSNTDLLVNYFMDYCGYREIWAKEKNTNLLKMRFPKDYMVGNDKELDYWLRVFSTDIKKTLLSKVKESGLISINFSSMNELFSKYFLDNHLRTISDFYINKKVERATNLVQLTKRKKDSLLAILQGKSYGLASQMDKATFGVVMKRAKVPEIQLNRDLEIANQQYGQSIAALSTASLDLERNRPFISVVDDIRLPLTSEYPKPLKKGITFGIIGLLLSTAIIVGIILGLDFVYEQKRQFAEIQKTN